MDWSLIGRSVFWGLVGGLSAIVTSNGLPTNSVGYAGLALAILWAGYGKGSTSTKTWAWSREEWTADQKRIAAGLPPKRPSPTDPPVGV